VLTENHGLYTRMPADDYLDFFGQIYNLSPSERRARTTQLLEQFGLQDHAHKPLGQFSKGMRQKLALARALVHNPPVLLLDEPTSAMDPESARLVRDALHELRSADRAVIICTHNLAEAEELAGQIAIIRQGRIIAHGSPQALKEQMLGPAEFLVTITQNLSVRPEGAMQRFPDVQLPQEARLISSGPDWLRYQTANPQGVNPAVAQALMAQGYGVVTLQEAPRNLEQVYLQAMTQSLKRDAG
jgi:ABC-2 type transport system ATP-binding protein